MAYRTLDLQNYANNIIPLSRQKINQDRDKKTLPKFYAATGYTQLCMQETRVPYVTVLQRNLRIQFDICDCVSQQPVYTTTKNSKKKYKKVSRHTILQIKVKIKEPHSESKQILVKNLQDKPTSGWAPQWSCQFYCSG